MERAAQIQEMKKQQARTYEQAAGYFKRVFNIEPEEAESEVKWLEAMANNLEQKLKPLRDSLPPLVFEREEFKIEYHKRRLLAEIHRDRAQILKRLGKLERETRNHTLPPMQLMNCIKSETKLNKINEQDLKKYCKIYDPNNKKH